MPYPNQHAARMMNPDDFEPNSFRNKELTDGIMAVMGKKKGSRAMSIQSYRFDKKIFTVEEAHKWMAEHSLKPMMFEPASKKEESNMAEFQEIEIFKPGKHTDMSGTEIDFSEAVCKQIANSYDPEVFLAPIVRGHPKHNEPADGWISGLGFNGKLVAKPDQMDASFVEMVKEGKYKKVSASFYLPDSPSNPLVAAGKPAGYYLRHVGFLGAMAPAVKGLKPVAFAEDEKGVISLEFSEHTEGMIAKAIRGLREWILSKWSKEEADKAIPPEMINHIEASCMMDKMGEMKEKMQAEKPMESASMSEAQNIIQEAEKQMDEKEKLALKAAQAQLEKDRADFAETVKALKAKEDALRKSETVSFVETLKGKILPVHKEGLVACLMSLKSESVEFGETKTTTVDFIKKLLTELPTVVNFGEIKDEKLVEVEKLSPEQIARKLEQIAFAEKEKTGKEITTSQAIEILKKEGAK